MCNAVLDVWQPTADRKAVINLPATVENAMPHVFAQQVRIYLQKPLYRENVVLSLHPHNDRGCAVAASEMGLLAGADRVEGTLFGNGERTGNADVVTIAMNMFSQGVDPQLDFSSMPEICEKYTEYTQMSVSPRQPYAGSLVFAAFSGSHQDAIAKGMQWRKEHDDAALERAVSAHRPAGRRPGIPDGRHPHQQPVGQGRRRLYFAGKLRPRTCPPSSKRRWATPPRASPTAPTKSSNPPRCIRSFWMNLSRTAPRSPCPSATYRQLADGIEATVTVAAHGERTVVAADGNGRLDAVTNALKEHFGLDFMLTTYEQHALSEKSDSKALSFVGLEKDGKSYWGAGINEDIIRSSVDALASAMNNLMRG